MEKVHCDLISYYYITVSVVYWLTCTAAHPEIWVSNPEQSLVTKSLLAVFYPRASEST